MPSMSKIKHAVMNQEHIAMYCSQQQVFKIFDAKTKGVVLTLPEQANSVGIVNAISI